MSLSKMLSELLESGRVLIPHGALDARSDLDATRRILVEFERIARQDFPGEAPAFDVEAAMWSAEMFFRASRLLVLRDIERDDVLESLSAKRPQQPTAALYYSVDLVFRFLPELLRFARAAAEADSLVTMLVDWCRAWPLSSVGVPNIGPVDIDAIIEHPALRRQYVDRVLRLADQSRWADERVRQLAQETVGALITMPLRRRNKPSSA